MNVLRHGQLGYHGHVTQFKQKCTKSLPYLPQDIAVLTVRRPRGDNGEFSRHPVRRFAIQHALEDLLLAQSIRSIHQH